VIYIVLPGGIDDPAAPSGGNTYDRRLCDGLAAAGWSVREHAVPGAWPRPAAADRDRLAAALAAVPDGATVLLDGLVACPAPEVVAPASDRLRLVVLAHLPLADETGLAPAVAAELDAAERRSLRAAAAVIATSGWAARRLVDHHRLPADRVHVAAPGVDAAPLAPGTDGASRLLCVAAVTPRKGQDLLVEALAKVADRPWHCDCAGGWDRAPDYADRVRGLVREHRLSDRIRLLGPRTGDDLAAAYAAADLVVLASHAETYGMVVTEALARGIPAVVTGVGGAPEALGHAPGGDRPGILVPAADPAALAGALRRWLDEPDTRDRLRRAARARRDTLPGWDATVRAVAGVLEPR
jgi:glycosyltransferase involved in cell wall biosynthesis